MDTAQHSTFSFFSPAFSFFFPPFDYSILHTPDTHSFFSKDIYFSSFLLFLFSSFLTKFSVILFIGRYFLGDNRQTFFSFGERKGEDEGEEGIAFDVKTHQTVQKITIERTNPGLSLSLCKSV